MVEREFRVGDKITCNVYGVGEVIGTIEAFGLKIGILNVKFIRDNNVFYINYDIKGKLLCDLKQFNKTAKRSLFIIPKRKPTLAEVESKYKELLDSVKELEFKIKLNNYCTYAFYDLEENKYNFVVSFDSYINEIGRKYISEEDANMIVKEMEKFIETEV